MKFSVVICTHNRCQIMLHCLQSIVDFGGVTTEYEVLVVDNASTDDTADTFRTFQSLIPNLRYVQEPKVGLSHARNKGALEANSNWLLYLDDDAKITPTTLPEYIKVIQEYDFKLFTGIFKPWYLDPPPMWMKDNLVSYILKGKKGIRSINNDYISGGVMGVDKNLLIELGMFDIQLGMKGNTIGYGEESDIQYKAQQKGYTVGINTDLVIEHLVGKHKYDSKWHLNSAYKKGFDAYMINPYDNKFSWVAISLNLLERSIKNFLRFSYQLIFKRDYYWTNWYIDNFGPISGFLGIIDAKRKLNSKKSTAAS